MDPDRCTFCRKNPAGPGQRLCVDCGGRYEAFDCPRCGSPLLRLRREGAAAHCSGCEADDLLGQLSAADRDRLGAMLGPGQNIPIIMELRRLLGLELRIAVGVLEALYRSEQTQST
ncbi:MAG TPA: hypothetical protein VD886_04410 [Herpetosiphonaceae bacterium]|nr:hypothetical protein [Herpetosiphonaceae bacterium]